MENTAIQNELALPVNYETRLTPQQAQKVTELQASIDMHNKGKVIAYGREEQAKVGKFYDSILSGVGTKEIGESGALLTKVIGDIQGYNVSCSEEDKGILGFLRKQKSKIKNMQTRYKSLAENMDTVVDDLNAKDSALGQVSRNFDVMYDENNTMYEFLSMLIFAGEQALKAEKEKHKQMKAEASASGDLMELQKASDFNDDILRFERRLQDLKLSRAISYQQSSQIKNIQKGADEVSESIKTTIVTAIPIWKSQMAIALGMQAVREGLNAVNAVRDATNAMLIANSQMNKQLALETAQAVERGVVDIETINTVNQNLIDSLTGSYEIAQQAITKREADAKQLQANEVALKNAMIQYASSN